MSNPEQNEKINNCVTKSFKFQSDDNSLQISIEKFQFCETLPLSDAISLLNGSDDMSGKMLWPGSMVACEFIVNHQSWFQSKTVLELGSGVGLTGLVLSKICNSVILTDRNMDSLKLLKQNLSNNEVSNCSCEQLEWGNDLQQLKQKYPNVDHIFGADIIYSPDTMPGLWETVNELLSTNPDSKFIVIYDPSFDEAVSNLIITSKKFNFVLRGPSLAHTLIRKALVFSRGS